MSYFIPDEWRDYIDLDTKPTRNYSDYKYAQDIKLKRASEFSTAIKVLMDRTAGNMDPEVLNSKSVIEDYLDSCK